MNVSMLKARLLWFVACVSEEMGQETEMKEGCTTQCEQSTEKSRIFQSAPQLKICFYYTMIYFNHMLCSPVFTFVGCEEQLNLPSSGKWPVTKRRMGIPPDFHCRYAKCVIITIIIAPQPWGI